MKFAVIGCAHPHIGEFITDMLKLKGEFAGIYNDCPEAAAMSEKYNVPLYDSMDELLSSGITLAGTAAVNSKKMDVIEKCAEHGVHVMADKPIAINEEQYSRLEKVIKSGRIEVGLMLTVRFMGPACTVKKLVDGGRIGKLVSVEIFNPHRLRPESRPEWIYDNSLYGGVIIDLIVHSVDYYSWLTGSKISDFHGTVTKSILPDKPDFFDCYQVLVNSDNGVSGYFRVDWHIPDTHWSWGDMRIFCVGTKGCIEARAVGDPVTREAQVILYEAGRETGKVDIEDINSNVTEDFVNRICGKDYVIGHKDILEACRYAVMFDRQARKVIL